ncbi:MAG: dienelactone hydrolase family protein [Rhodospirillaceae bacterium]|nr:dienelactone hydrolase family protein [Rhodospirillaceae bacterium]MBT4425967.1 dienelactone hydrolase family protein [Rhodospirillaceae bacterium]MBT5674565.1 dienelactone hydrolase family protein [Rhodospirillaceae bacterium]
MGEFIALTAEDGHGFDAYRAAPQGPAKAGLLVIQEIFGVNGHIQSVCDAFAADGYLAIAPAIFDRKQRKVDLGYTAETVAEGRALKDDVGWVDPVPDMQAGLAALRTELGAAAKIGVVGYCWGGTLAWLAACRLETDCVIGYYGGQIGQFIDEQPRSPTMLHFGSEDAGIPLDSVEAIRAAHEDVEIHIYDGAGHGFACDQRADYHPTATALARERSMAHFAKHLGRKI